MSKTVLLSMSRTIVFHFSCISAFHPVIVFVSTRNAKIWDTHWEYFDVFFTETPGLFITKLLLLCIIYLSLFSNWQSLFKERISLNQRFQWKLRFDMVFKRAGRRTWLQSMLLNAHNTQFARFTNGFWCCFVIIWFEQSDRCFLPPRWTK